MSPRGKHAHVAGHAREEPTNRLVPMIAMCAYAGYFLTGFISGLVPPDSFAQLLSWQVGSGLAIAANVLAGVWAARLGQDIAAAGFTMLGVVECVFFSSITLTQVEPFLAQYSSIAAGNHRAMDALQQASFISQQAVGLIWSYYFWKQLKIPAGT